MACSIELSLLKEEEKVLLKILSKLNDHLNRLKVEELALQSYIRKQKNDQQSQMLQQKSTTTSTTSFAVPLPVAEKAVDFTTAVNLEPLMDLNVNTLTTPVKSGPAACESEDEEDI